MKLIKKMIQKKQEGKKAGESSEAALLPDRGGGAGKGGKKGLKERENYSIKYRNIPILKYMIFGDRIGLC